MKVILDFGGFLGMGTSQVNVGFDELTILTDEGRTAVRVYIDATKEQIQAQPQYRAVNGSSGFGDWKRGPAGNCGAPGFNSHARSKVSIIGPVQAS